MAEIAYHDLIAWLKMHPDYQNLCLGVEADVVLYIRFGAARNPPLDTMMMTTSDGSELAIDRERDGTVVGLEII